MDLLCFKQKKCNHILFTRCGYPGPSTEIYNFSGDYRQRIFGVDFTNSNFSSQVQVHKSQLAARLMFKLTSRFW